MNEPPALAAWRKAREAAFPRWRCAQCGKEKPGTAHQLRKTFCSRACVNASGAYLVSGAARAGFHVPRRQIWTCLHCGATHKAIPHVAGKRRYCSMKCFKESGAASLAGRIGAEVSTLKYGARKDANHKELMAVLKKYCAVYDMSHAGCGVPDGVAWVGDKAWHLFDIKNPKTGYGKRGLNEVQRKWLSNRQGGGPVFLLYTVEEAERFAKGELDGLKFEVGSTDAMNRV